MVRRHHRQSPVGGPIVGLLLSWPRGGDGTWAHRDIYSIRPLGAGAQAAETAQNWGGTPWRSIEEIRPKTPKFSEA
jgi:hypothetical protein